MLKKYFKKFMAMMQDRKVEIGEMKEIWTGVKIPISNNDLMPFYFLINLLLLILNIDNYKLHFILFLILMVDNIYIYSLSKKSLMINICIIIFLIVCQVTIIVYPIIPILFNNNNNKEKCYTEAIGNFFFLVVIEIISGSYTLINTFEFFHLLFLV